MMDLEPTGKQVTVTGVTISRLEGGKLVEDFRNWDFHGMMRKLEAPPVLARG